MKLKTLLAIAKSEGFVLDYVIPEGPSLRLNMPNARRNSFVVSKNTTKHKLYVRIQSCIQDEIEYDREQRERSARIRRNAMRSRVYNGGKWHTLPVRSKAVLKLVINNNEKEVA